MSRIFCNKTVLLLLVLLAAVSCRRQKIRQVHEMPIVISAPSFAGTKADIGGVNDLQTSNKAFGVFGYKTKLDDNPNTFYQLFYNTPVYYSNNTWAYTPTRYWDSNPNVSYQFIAYWPHRESDIVPTSLNDISSTEHMSVTLEDIPNWQNVSDANTVDYLKASEVGCYKSNNPDLNKFGDHTVHFTFDHILAKLIIKGYYVGVQETHINITDVTLKGTQYLSPSGTADYKCTPYANTSGFAQNTIEKLNAQQDVSHVLYHDSNNGCDIPETAFKENEDAVENTDYTPTPVCSWLIVPTSGWENLSLSITYSVGEGSSKTTVIEDVVFGSGNSHLMESGKSYILNLVFNTAGGIELEAMYVNKWENVDVDRPVFNW